MKKNLDGILSTFLCLILALMLTGLVILVAGESPWLVAQVLFHSSLGSLDAFSYTLFYSTPLIFTGLAVLLPYKAGLFNIGAEGQLYMGSAVCALTALFFSQFLNGDNPSLFLSLFSILAGILSAFVGGGLYGLIPGAFRAYWGIHEVITTIMLNFVAYAFSNWVILYAIKNPATQSVESSPIASILQIPNLFLHAPASFLLAVACAIVLLLALKKTWWGYRIRACGNNERAAHIAGISVKTTLISTFFISGGLAGLVGFHEVFCHSYKLIDSFSPQFGFTGIAIALLCRGNPFGFFAAVFFFGAIHKGALDLDLETEKITKDLAAVIQSTVLVSMAVSPAMDKFIRKMRRNPT